MKLSFIILIFAVMFFGIIASAYIDSRAPSSVEYNVCTDTTVGDYGCPGCGNTHYQYFFKSKAYRAVSTAEGLRLARTFGVKSLDFHRCTGPAFCRCGYEWALIVWRVQVIDYKPFYRNDGNTKLVSVKESIALERLLWTGKR